MPELSEKLISLLVFLLPGFLAMQVFFGMTSFQKSSPFERVVQALVATYAVKVFVTLIAAFFDFLSDFIYFGVWDYKSDLVASFFIAIVLGWVAALSLNTGFIPELIRRFGKTTRDGGAPSEWVRVFDDNKSYITLHMKDGRRLTGWPTVWPSNPKGGHFFITHAAWVSKSKEIPLDHLDGLLISADDVEFIEFVK